MSRDTYSVLKRFLQDKNQSIVMNVIQEHLYVDMYEGVPRNKAQVESTAGAMEGEANRQGTQIKRLERNLKTITNSLHLQ